MIERLGVGLFGTLLLAIALAWAIGPRRLLAALFAVPMAWGLITAVIVVGWLVMRL